MGRKVILISAAIRNVYPFRHISVKTGMDNMAHDWGQNIAGSSQPKYKSLDLYTQVTCKERVARVCAANICHDVNTSILNLSLQIRIYLREITSQDASGTQRKSEAKRLSQWPDLHLEDTLGPGLGVFTS